MSEHLRDSREDLSPAPIPFIPSPKSFAPERLSGSETKTPRKLLHKPKESLFVRKSISRVQNKSNPVNTIADESAKQESKKQKKKLKIKLDFFKEKMDLRQKKGAISTLISKKPSELILKNFEIFDNLIKKKHRSIGLSAKKTKRARPEPRDSACLLKMSRSDSFLQVDKDDPEAGLQSTDRVKVPNSVD